MTDKDIGDCAVDDETLLDSAFLDERSNSIKKLNRSDTLKKWYREPSHRQVLFFFLYSSFMISKSHGPSIGITFICKIDFFVISLNSPAVWANII